MGCGVCQGLFSGEGEGGGGAGEGNAGILRCAQNDGEDGQRQEQATATASAEADPPPAAKDDKGWMRMTRVGWGLGKEMRGLFAALRMTARNRNRNRQRQRQVQKQVLRLRRRMTKVRGMTKGGDDKGWMRMTRGGVGGAGEGNAGVLRCAQNDGRNRQRQRTGNGKCRSRSSACGEG